MINGERPGDQPAPVVADDHGLARPEVLDYRQQVANQLADAVALDTLRLSAQVIAPLIDGHDVEVARQSRHLSAP